ncbi:MAG: nucleotidyltransferase family protein [Alphaproteobacteria bacterium]|nr:nucleotidyltransferase family protein [Alphaproteobacteria bacterium]
MTEPLVAPSDSLRDAIAVIEQYRKTLAVVVDEDRRVVGTVSDGDVRRGLLRGRGLDTPVAEVMNDEPTTVPTSADADSIVEILHERGIEAIPLVDAEGRFATVSYIGDLGHARPRQGGEGFFGAVIMAGGEGRRLGHLTEDTPKPMLEVGGMPLVERSIRFLAECGIDHFYIATNYLGHHIEDHFQGGEDYGVKVSYLKEPKKLGTAGALSLLPEQPAKPILVLNGDIVTTLDPGKLLDYHLTQSALMTVVAVEHLVQIPFGVLLADGDRAVAVEEKPSQRFLCNAGIYCLSPQALKYVPSERYFDMTDLISAALLEDETVPIFPLHEYWTDIGVPEDLEKARRDIEAIESENG